MINLISVFQTDTLYLKNEQNKTINIDLTSMRKRIINQSKSEMGPTQVVLCAGFFEKFLGLMFKKDLAPDSGILIDQGVDSTIGSAIHMLFMNFPIAAIWVNSDLIVVDARIAKPWKPAYFPRHPARYIIELSVNQLSDFDIGDQLHFYDE